MVLEKTVVDSIRQRFSCRKYLDEPIAPEKRQKLIAYIASLPQGPFGGQASFHLVSANETDRSALKDLGTYGFIHGATGFIVGATGIQAKSLEDYGYQMEQIILYATSLELGTCWLGGSFTRSSFAKKINATDDACIPAVTAIGEIIDVQQARNGLLRRQIKADLRLPWEQLFFNGQFGAALGKQAAGDYALALEMLRIGPSASNKQPWRVLRDGKAWHFYLQRTKGYREGSLTRFLGVADIQRLDMGIAMCHFEQTAREIGLPGRWVAAQPPIKMADEMTEYTVSWLEE